MNINYVLSAHGITGRNSDSKLIYEGVSNLTVQTLTNGTQLSVTWTNPTIPEYVKTELFVSTSDISNLDYDQTVSNATRVINGNQSSYTHNSTVGITYYFKAYVTYTTFGETVVSRGVTSSVTAIDTTPPSPISNVSATVDNSRVNLSWTNPADTDFLKVKILYKTGSYPASPTDGFVGYEGSGTSASITGLTNDTQYYFRGFTYDNSLNVNTESTQQISAMPLQINIFGVRIDESNSNPNTSITYTDDAATVQNWDTVFPFNKIRPVVLKNGVVQYELDKNDFTKKKDGTNADITSGNDGDVMIEFPKVWWKFERVNNFLYIKYSNKKVDDGYKCLAHTDMNGIEKDFVYIGAYLGSDLNGRVRSLSNKSLFANQSFNSASTNSQANGSGYRMMHYYMNSLVKILFLLRFKTLDSQTVLGRGYVDANTATATTGGANAKGMTFGESTGKMQMKFLGIEDLWGNLYCWLDGIKSNAGNIVINDINYGFSSSAQVNEAYFSAITGTTETTFVPKTSSGSQTTYYTDMGLFYNSGLRVGYSGGYYTDGAKTGIFYLRVSLSDSTSYSNVCPRLCYL